MNSIIQVHRNERKSMSTQHWIRTRQGSNMKIIVVFLFLSILCGCRIDANQEHIGESNASDSRKKMKNFRIESIELRYQRCFSFPNDIWPTENSYSSIYFKFKDIKYFDGLAETPGILGSPYTSTVIISTFRNKELKEVFIKGMRLLPTLKDAGEFDLYEPAHDHGATYIAISKEDPLVIEYRRGHGRSDDRAIWTDEIRTLVKFINTSTIPCKEN